MTIGAVSSIYTPSVQYQYFGTSISPDRIQELMRRYGIMPSGNADHDLQALYQAMYSTASSDVKATENAGFQPPQKQPPLPEVIGNTALVPWANLMSQVGIPLTGTYEGDYNAFTQKINAMSLSATDQQQIASVDQLKAEAGLVFVKPTQPNLPKEPQKSAQHEITGADIIAQLNRMFITFS